MSASLALLALLASCKAPPAPQTCWPDYEPRTVDPNDDGAYP